MYGDSGADWPFPFVVVGGGGHESFGQGHLTGCGRPSIAYREDALVRTQHLRLSGTVFE